MNRQRCADSTPGMVFSTIKAVIFFFSLPSTVMGVCAITTMMSATGPFVHQSFSPFKT